MATSEEEPKATAAPLGLSAVRIRYPNLFREYSRLSDRERDARDDIGDILGDGPLPIDAATGLITTITHNDFAAPLAENYPGCPMKAGSDANRYCAFVWKMLSASESGSVGGDACRQFDVLDAALEDALAARASKFEHLLGWTAAAAHHGLDALLDRGDPERNRPLFKRAGDAWKKAFEGIDAANGDAATGVDEGYRKFAVSMCESFGKLLRMARKEYGDHARYTFNFIKKPRAPKGAVVSPMPAGAKSAASATTALAASAPREVTVVVTKPSKDAKLGLVIAPAEGTGAVKVKSIAPDSLFVGTDLKAGMTLKTVDGTNCDSFTQVLGALRAAEGRVIVVASDPVAVVPTAAASSSAVAAGSNQKENSAPPSNNSGLESNYDYEPKPWELDGWVPTTKGGKQKTPNVIRGELQRYIDQCKVDGTMTQTGIIQQMGVNNNTFRRFMNPKTYKNPWSAVENGTYWAAARLLEQVKHESAKAKKSGAKRKTAGGVDDGSSKKAKGLSNKMSKAEASDFLDRVNAVTLPPGTCEGTFLRTDIHDSCPQLVAKIKAFVQRDGMTKAALCGALGNINNNSMNRFLSGKGQDQCANVTYKAGYVFFEKLRILEGKEKSAARVRNEEENPSGFSVHKARAGKWKFLPGL